MTHWGESAHPKMEWIVQELHITNQTIKSEQHGGNDLKRQEWYNVSLPVGWLNREWAMSRVCSTAALCEKTTNVWLTSALFEQMEASPFCQSSSPEGNPP